MDHRHSSHGVDAGSDVNPAGRADIITSAKARLADAVAQDVLIVFIWLSAGVMP